MNMKTFLIWVWISIFQAAMIMFMTVTLFSNSLVNIVAITFSSLISLQMLNIIFTVVKVQKIMVICMLCTMALYIVCVIFFNTMFQMSYINWDFIQNTIITTIVCWAPI